jgi:hypothetical protein
MPTLVLHGVADQIVPFVADAQRLSTGQRGTVGIYQGLTNQGPDNKGAKSPQYITPRFAAAKVEIHDAPLKARIAELEANSLHATPLARKASTTLKSRQSLLKNPHKLEINHHQTKK